MVVSRPSRARRRGLPHYFLFIIPAFALFGIAVVTLRYALPSGNVSGGEAVSADGEHESARREAVGASDGGGSGGGVAGKAVTERYCRLGLPPDAAATETAAAAANGSTQHRLAVLIPYRQREAHLRALLAALAPYLLAQGRDFDIFVIEQTKGLLFNRGALLNAGALLLEGSSYDYYVFQDVDTIPTERGGIQYAYPAGAAPLHLTPHWLHPKSTYQDFFGGLLIVTPQQLRAVGGFGTQFWGWGREDDNLRERFKRTGLWPPQYPDVPKRGGLAGKRYYFQHQRHEQAKELRGQVDDSGAARYFEEDPRLPYRGASIMSSQHKLLEDYTSGLETTRFRVESVRPFLNATKFTVSLHCDREATPWCEPGIQRQRPPAVIKHAAAVHAVGAA